MFVELLKLPLEEEEEPRYSYSSTSHADVCYTPSYSVKRSTF